MTRRGRLAVLVVALLVTPVLVMGLGAAHVPAHQVLDVVVAHVTGHPDHLPRGIDAIVWDNRAPRVVSGLAVGAVLGVSGAVLQAVVRNPLAEPYVLGVSAGASTGAAVAMVLLGATGMLGVAGCAFAGAVAATLVVLGVGGRRGSTPLHLVLAGLAVGFVFQSVTNLIVFSSDNPETARGVLFWMLGSLARPSWPDALLASLVAVLMAIVFWVAAPVLDALATGDRTAGSVGVDPQRARFVLVVLVSLGVAVVVALAGGIGFAGLVVPHLVRARVGSSHRVLVPATAMGSAVFLAWADAASRFVFAPAEVPIGVVTGLLGAPCLLWMLRAQGAER